MVKRTVLTKWERFPSASPVPDVAFWNFGGVLLEKTRCFVVRPSVTSVAWAKQIDSVKGQVERFGLNETLKDFDADNTNADRCYLRSLHMDRRSLEEATGHSLQIVHGAAIFVLIKH
jgi:hypothetical protein